MFVALPEYIDCSIDGVNSPVIIRAEAGCEAGGMTIEEYLHTQPHVHLYGDTDAAKQAFRAALDALRRWVDDEADDRLILAWFQFDFRQSQCRVAFHSNVTGLKVEGACDKDQLRPVYERLRVIYERLFATILE